MGEKFKNTKHKWLENILFLKFSLSCDQKGVLGKGSLAKKFQSIIEHLSMLCINTKAHCSWSRPVKLEVLFYFFKKRNFIPNNEEEVKRGHGEALHSRGAWLLCLRAFGVLWSIAVMKRLGKQTPYCGNLMINTIRSASPSQIHTTNYWPQNQKCSNVSP